MQTKFHLPLFIILASFLFLLACTAQPEPEPVNIVIPQPTQEPVSQPETSQSSNRMDDCATPEKLCIGFLVEKDLIEANAFYQSAKQGVARTRNDLLASVSFIELDPTDDVDSIIDSMANEEYDIVVTAGPKLLVQTLDASQKYPEINFIGIDQDQFLNYENIIGITFDEQKSAFLAGNLAALMTKTNKVGVVLGEVAPTVYRYLEGFEAGVHSINPSIEVLSAFHSGDTNNVYDDPEWGRATAKAMLDDNADIIFAAGGETAMAALNETAKSPQALCIGADLDEASAQMKASHECLVSIIKRDVESKLFESIAWSSVNKFPNDNIEGSYQYASFYRFDQFFTTDIQDYFELLERRC